MEDKTVTVKDLKELITTLPEDTKIIIDINGRHCSPSIEMSKPYGANEDVLYIDAYRGYIINNQD